MLIDYSKNIENFNLKTSLKTVEINNNNKYTKSLWEPINLINNTDEDI